MKNFIFTDLTEKKIEAICKKIEEKTELICFSIKNYIEKKENNKIPEIVKKNGDKYLQNLESNALKKAFSLENIIILSEKPNFFSKEKIDKLKKSNKLIYLFSKEIDTSNKTTEEIANFIIKKFDLKKDTQISLKEKIKIHTGSKECFVFIGENIYKNLYKYIQLIKAKSKNIIIIGNPLILTLYYKKIKKSLKNNFNVLIFKIEDGEENKNLKTVEKIYDFLLEHKITKDDIILALGGGITGDIAGFVASTFKRGMNFIQIPTTLLAQVDSSIGGKTGINHKKGKNMIGTFYQPDLVVTDITFLKTLPENIYKSGISEIIKYAIIKDRNLFSILENEKDKIIKRENSVLAEIISKSIKIKKEIVEKDEKEESGIREILNFGHTIGHIIETETEYKKYSHGEAIAIGMYKESKIAEKKGLLNRDEVERIKNLLLLYNLPINPSENFTDSLYRNWLGQDKKVRKNKIKIPVPLKIGKTIIKEILYKNYI